MRDDALSFSDDEENITPELIAKITGAPKVLMPPSYFLRERLNSLMEMIENQLLSSAAMEIRDH